MQAKREDNGKELRCEATNPALEGNLVDSTTIRIECKLHLSVGVFCVRQRDFYLEIFKKTCAYVYCRKAEYHTCAFVIYLFLFTI
jgi:hypothetical protein